MQKCWWMMSNAARLGLVGGFFFLSIGCQGPQGPTWKDQVTLALDHFYKGESEFQKGNLETAEQEYQASLESSPRPKAYFRLAQVQSQLNKEQEAIHNLDQALQLNPDFQRASVFKEQLLLRKGTGTSEVIDQEEPSDSIGVQLPQPDDLLQTVPSNQDESASENNPVQSSIAKSQEEIETEDQQGNALQEDAEQTKEDLPSISSSSFDDQTDQAKEIAKTGDWNRAQSQFEKIKNEYPDVAMSHYNYGYSCFHLNQYEEAETAFRKAVELDPQFADAYNDLGVTLEKKKQSGEAMDAYEKAVEIGSNSDAFFNLALLKEKQGMYKASVELYEKYLKLDSQSAFAKYARERIEKLKRLAY